MPPTDAERLRAVKLLHTAVWAFFAACVLGIPVAVARGNLMLAAWLIGAVAVETAVLLVNSWRCPLTDVAARYTGERHPNFDIYLPVWLARYNKLIFGTLYLMGIMYTLMRWRSQRG